ncbi:hypothetical protein [Tunicatimonas pelagia]|uniref:hypothetical protein n=1 Tax=Tunicatimonas pelagia TaxID=931531 RepID=UPI0026671078|nr:hypothetical protein [Tunicatimonas pelagia]WKN44760.1 hypothetical protein P0M28_07255 [Tunicatimonas pelagia]
MSDNKKPTAPPKAADPKIEAIKDIIFGDTIQEIEQEFSDLMALIEKHKATADQQMTQMRTTMDELAKELRHELDEHANSLKEEMTQKFSQLQNSSADRSSLGKMLEEIGKKLQA